MYTDKIEPDGHWHFLISWRSQYILLPLAEEFHARLPLVHQPHHEFAGPRLGAVLGAHCPLAGESHSLEIYFVGVLVFFPTRPLSFTRSSEWKIEAHLISQTSLSHSHEVKIRYPDKTMNTSAL